jgi:hypothetical protein
MAIELDTLRSEIETFLEQSNLAAFRGFGGLSESTTVYWDVKGVPNFQAFLHVAERAGVRLVVFHHEQFLLDEIDEIREELEGSGLAREDQRNFELRIRELQKYEGFLARLQLSFSLEGKTYLYEVEADWYRAWQDLVMDIDTLVSGAPEELDDDGSMSGYFSAN